MRTRGASEQPFDAGGRGYAMYMPPLTCSVSPVM